MSTLKRYLAAIVLAIPALLAGCGGGGGGGGAGGSTGDGSLRVSLTDAPSCGYSQVWVTVTDVLVHRSADAAEESGGWESLGMTAPVTVDLLTLSNGVLLELGQSALPAGSYQQIRLVLAANTGSSNANWLVLDDDEQTEVALSTPSAQQTGLKLNANIVVPDGGEVDVVLDFDACRSVVKAGNSGRYNLKPVIAVIPMVSVGSINGYVALATPAEQAIKVSAQFEGVPVKETEVASGEKFNLYPVAAGTYDLVITSAGRVTQVIRGVPVATGGATPVNLSDAPIVLGDSDVGTVDGTVLDAGVTPEVAMPAAVRALQEIAAGEYVEVATLNSGDGAYSMELPLADVMLAAPVFPSPPLTPPPSLGFSPLAGSGASYRIEATATGYAPGILDVTVPSTGQDITLTPL